MGLKIMTREQWGAEPKRKWSFVDGPVSNVFVTYTGKNPCNNHEWCVFVIRKLQQMHIYKRGCPDIRYNFCIGGNGYIYEGRGWDNRPTLPKKYSDFTCTSVFIAYMGHFLDKPPGQIMHSALEDLIMSGVRQSYIRPKFLQFRI